MTTLAETDPKLRACSILHQVALGRQQVYRWLALGFYPPDAQLAQALNTGQFVEEILLATVWLGEDRNKFLHGLAQLRECPSIGMSELANDYERLFGKSVERVPMHEAAYRWREATAVLETANEVTSALRHVYGQFGVTPIANNEDLLPVELELMAFLCEREAAEWNVNNSSSARQLRLQERTFLDDHLGRWFPEFCRRVSERSPSCFYHALILLCDNWLELEYGPGYLPARFI